MSKFNEFAYTIPKIVGLSIKVEEFYLDSMKIGYFYTTLQKIEDEIIDKFNKRNFSKIGFACKMISFDYYIE